MKELCKLSEEKGFKCRTFSTRWTMDHYIERGKAKFMVNKECMIILLAEIQSWIRENYNVDIVSLRSFSMSNSYHYYIVNNMDFDNAYQQVCIANRTYEEALKEGLLEALKLIPDAKIQDN